MTAKIATPKSTRLKRAKKPLTVLKSAARGAKPAKGALTVKRSAAKAAAATDDTMAKPAKKHKKERKATSKAKVVRDSFTMPQADYDLIAELKQRCQKQDMHVKKSELLRAGLQVLSKLNAAQLKRALSGLEKIKTGRPKKS